MVGNTDAVIVQCLKILVAKDSNGAVAKNVKIIPLERMKELFLNVCLERTMVG